MKRARSVVAVCLLSSVCGAGLAFPPDVVDGGETGAGWPSWMEPWLYNPQERTQRAIEAMERDEAEEAIEPLDTALELDPENPSTRYNAGTARLQTSRPGAMALLQSAAETAQESELLSQIHYNLGNAKMTEEDYGAAVEAFKRSLRHAPEYEDAKYNLELALRRLEQQQQSQDPQEEEEDEQEQQDDQGQQEEQQQPPPPPPSDEQNEEDQGEQERESPLPQFRDLPDMSAEEAAAILEAVENMERERRREEAMEAARANAQGKKDW